MSERDNAFERPDSWTWVCIQVKDVDNRSLLQRLYYSSNLKTQACHVRTRRKSRLLETECEERDTAPKPPEQQTPPLLETRALELVF